MSASDDYLAVTGFAPPFPLVEVDSDGVDDPLVVDADLGTTFPEAGGSGPSALAADRLSDDVFVAPAVPGLGVVYRDAAGASAGADVLVPFEPFGFSGRAEDLHFTRAPEPNRGLLQLGAVLSLGWLTRRAGVRRACAVRRARGGK